jgi:hypothetical protein
MSFEHVKEMVINFSTRVCRTWRQSLYYLHRSPNLTGPPMFKLLSSLFSKNVPAVPELAGSENQVLTDAQLLRAHFSVTEQDEEALRRFVTLITDPLGTEESRRLTELAVSRLRLGDTPADVMHYSLLGELQSPGKWLLIQVDWKDTDEVEPQANEMLTIAGVTETWRLQSQTNTTVVQALLAPSSWVEQRGFHLLHLDLGDDAYRALLAAADKSEQIMRAAQDAGLKLQRTSDFAADNAGSM